ncbi:MAG: L-2-amino-thiazoline-4-carboxylic acid hydrolase [Firmicutes bacterium]|nr:L-2-amino-thiazoline-4-carboxylic acid hydrolase [Bacillota bacterium]
MELRPRHHALLFSCIAKAAVERLGQPGEEAITRGVIAYGEQRGRRMARRAERDGVKIDAKAYLLYGEWYDKYKESDFSCTAYQPEVRMGCTVCPWCDAWIEADMSQYGELYCSVVDAALARGFGLELELISSKALGGDECRFRFPDQGIDDAELAELKEQAARLGLKAKMGWEYHDGHLYASLRQALTNACGEAGRQAAEAGLADFGRLCGEEAAALVAANAEQDFEALPPYEGL